MKRLNEVVWGVIGAGKVCEKKSMPAMQIISHSRVKTVMRRNKDACRDFAQRHQIPFYTTNAEELLQDPEINALYIATPPGSHADYCKAAAAAGKAVYVEKPMALNYAECQAMIRACKDADVSLFVAYYRRMLPHFRRIKELLKQEAVGTPCSVHIDFKKAPYPEDINSGKNWWRIRPEFSGGGHFHDLASHQLDLLDYLFGPLHNIRGNAVNRGGFYDAADTVTASFLLSDNTAGSGNWCFVCPEEEKKDEIIILGTEGSLKFSTFAHARIHGISKKMGMLQEEFELPPHIQEYLIRTIVAELRGEGKCPSTGESAARTTKAMDLICA